MPFIKTLRYPVLACLLAYPGLNAAEIQINGLSESAENQLKASLTLNNEACDSPEWKIRHLLAESNQQIDRALRALGYYHSSSQHKLNLDGECWLAEFDIDAGPATLLDKIDIRIDGEAKDDEAFQKLIANLQSAKGSQLNHAAYEAMKSKLESLAMERGYFNGRLTGKKLSVDKDNNRANIELAFQSGQRLHFGAVDLEQDILEPELVNKLIQVKPGDSYHSDILAKTHDALSKSGYFKTVDIHPELKRVENGQVPIHLSLVPQKQHHYSIGAGFDTDKGPLLGIGYKNRRLNRAGHLLDLNLDLSPVLATADGEYAIPLDHPLSDFFSFGAGLKREDTESYQSLSAKYSARLKHKLDNGWKQTLFIDESYESYKTDGENRETLLLLPGASWLRSVADNTLRPSEGYRLEFNVGATYQNPLSDISMAQGSLAAVWIHPSPWNGRLLLRAQQGATVVDHFDKLPTSYRYYAGGMNSIRGYAYKELGPKDEQGHVIGGRFISVVSAEYEQNFLENWGIAAFIDSGNAYNLDNISIKTGAGLGARWYSPIGLVRLDFGVPLNDANDSFQVHFAAGTRL